MTSKKRIHAYAGEMRLVHDEVSYDVANFTVKRQTKQYVQNNVVPIYKKTEGITIITE